MSVIQRAYKTELDLNDKQTTAFRKHAGAARWAYNWGVGAKTGSLPSHGQDAGSVRPAPRTQRAQAD
jgi:hypothetical protein